MVLPGNICLSSDVPPGILSTQIKTRHTGIDERLSEGVVLCGSRQQRATFGHAAPRAVEARVVRPSFEEVRHIYRHLAYTNHRVCPVDLWI